MSTPNHYKKGSRFVKLWEMVISEGFTTVLVSALRHHYMPNHARTVINVAEVA